MESEGGRVYGYVERWMKSDFVGKVGETLGLPLYFATGTKDWTEL